MASDHASTQSASYPAEHTSFKNCVPNSFWRNLAIPLLEEIKIGTFAAIASKATMPNPSEGNGIITRETPRISTPTVSWLTSSGFTLIRKVRRPEFTSSVKAQTFSLSVPTTVKWIEFFLAQVAMASVTNLSPPTTGLFISPKMRDLHCGVII